MPDEFDLEVDSTDLTPGQTYRVEFSDCCVGGEFTGKFRRLNTANNPWTEDAVFDVGRINVSSAHFYEVTP